MKEKIKLAVLIPVGPTCKLKYLLDTLDSINYYCSNNKKVIIINDSGRKLKINLFKYDAIELFNPRIMGKEYGLYYSLCSGLKYIIDHYTFEVLLRLDTDALITGPKPENDAIKYFKSHPEIGMIGSYRVNPFQKYRSFSHARRTILWETSLIGKIIDSLIFRRINNYRKYIIEAKLNGYELGEHVLGGAVYYSYHFISKLNENNLLFLPEFKGTRLQEDFIFAIFAFIINLKMGDFVTNNYPMFLAWKGLAASPEYIVKHDKKIIHSVRFYKNKNESEIRKFFKHYRT